MDRTTAQRIGYGLLAAALVLLPALLGTLLIGLQYPGRTWADFTPLGDETWYWHQTATARVAPFGGGFYTFYEVPTTIQAFGRYSTWGPFVPLYYAAVSNVVGWSYAAIPLVNLLTLTFALALMVWVVRPHREGLVLAIVALLAFTPLWLYINTGLSETLVMAAAVGLAAGFAPLLMGRDLRPRYLVALAAYILLISLTLRVTFSLYLLLLAGWLALGRSPLIWLRNGALAVGASGVLFVVYSGLRSFFPFRPHRTILTAFADAGVNAGVVAALDHWTYNLNGVRWAPWTNQAFYVLLAGLAALLLVCWLVAFFWREPPAWVALPGRAESAAHLFNLVAIFAVIALFYELYDWRGYRTIAPHLLVSLLWLAVLRRRWLVIAAFVFSLFVLQDAWVNVYPDNYRTENRYVPEVIRPPLADNIVGLSEYLAYVPDAPSPWCNTVTVNSGDPFTVVALPPGMGFSLVPAPDPQHFPAGTSWFRSRYLWLDPHVYDAFAANGRAEQIGIVAGRTLYLNLDSDCSTR